MLMLILIVFYDIIGRLIYTYLNMALLFYLANISNLCLILANFLK